MIHVSFTVRVNAAVVVVVCMCILYVFFLMASIKDHSVKAIIIINCKCS